MSGFDTSRGNSGTTFRSKQFGSILRGYGPPVPQAGVVGDLYIDIVSWNLFEKRDIDGLDDWGHYLFNVPGIYRTSLKWFGAASPNNSIGVAGDYFLQWSGFPNYGMQPIIWGPKLWTGWPENGDGGPGTVIAAGHTEVHQLGMLDEGPDLVDMQLSQLMALGLFDEYVIPFPVTANPGDPVLQLGMQTSGKLVSVDINPLYTAEDEHAL
jgi:hypothetical protein